MKRNEVLKFLREHPDAEIVNSITRSCKRPEYVALKVDRDYYNFDIRTFRWLLPQLEFIRSYSGGEMHFVYRLRKDIEPKDAFKMIGEK